jgi:hypothetical protein
MPPRADLGGSLFNSNARNDGQMAVKNQRRQRLQVPYTPPGETNALSVDAAPRAAAVDFAQSAFHDACLVSGWSQVTADGGAAAQDGDLCASPAVSRTRRREQEH